MTKLMKCRGLTGT